MKKHDISSLEDLSIKSNNDLEWYWKSVDEDIGIVWDKHYTKVLDVSKGMAWSKWFVGGKTNIYKSSVEKFVKLSPKKIAYYFESEDGETSNTTYSELDSKVSKLANALKYLGVKKGDVIKVMRGKYSKKEGKMESLRRFFTPPKEKSYFIFGPRGTGKSTWVKNNYHKAVVIDLLEPEIFRQYKSFPERLRERVEASNQTTFIIFFYNPSINMF